MRQRFMHYDVAAALGEHLEELWSAESFQPSLNLPTQLPVKFLLTFRVCYQL